MSIKSPLIILIIVISIISLAVVIYQKYEKSKIDSTLELIKEIDKKLKNEIEIKYVYIAKNNNIIYYSNGNRVATDNINEKGYIFKREYYDKNDWKFATSYFDETGRKVANELVINGRTKVVPVYDPEIYPVIVIITSITGG